MKRYMNILSVLIVNMVFLFGGCTPEKVIPPAFGGNNTRPTDSDLVNFEGKAEPVSCGRNLAQRFIDQRNSNWGRMDKASSTFVTYPDVCAYLGAFWYAEEAGDLDIIQQLVNKYDDVITGKAQPNGKPLITNLLWRCEDNKVDYYSFGAISLHIASIMDKPEFSSIRWPQTKEEYLKFGLEYADSQFTLLSKDEFNRRYNSKEFNTGKLPEKDHVTDAKYKKWKEYADEGYSWQTRLWIDDMFMITALQLQAYQATKNDPSKNNEDGQNRYLANAVREMTLYIKELPGSGGIYWHSPSARFFWSRGNGWMAVGMPEVLKVIEDMPEYKEEAALLLAEYKEMMATLLKYQQWSGTWGQLIDHPEMWAETSGTAMFTYAFLTGVHRGWLDKDKYGAAARHAWLELMDYLNEDYDIREVCVGTGTGNSFEHYNNRERSTGETHGQAAMLWCTYGLTQIKNAAAKEK